MHQSTYLRKENVKYFSEINYLLCSLQESSAINSYCLFISCSLYVGIFQIYLLQQNKL